MKNLWIILLALALTGCDREPYDPVYFVVTTWCYGDPTYTEFSIHTTWDEASTSAISATTRCRHANIYKLNGANPDDGYVMLWEHDNFNNWAVPIEI